MSDDVDDTHNLRCKVWSFKPNGVDMIEVYVGSMGHGCSVGHDDLRIIVYFVNAYTSMHRTLCIESTF